MAVIPWKVDVPQDKLPFINWLIVAAACLVFFLQISYVLQAGSSDDNPLTQFVLDSFDFKELVGYMWLHGGILHLIGNMLFLWIFGNAVCAKIGNLIYLPVYVLFGILSGIAHLIFMGGSVVGASGAINGIVGMYLVFFPENDITCYWVFLPFIKQFTVSSFWMILFWLAFDLFGVFALGDSAGVAYFAHLGGFAAGFALAVLMLKTGYIQMTRYEKSLLQFFDERKSSSENSHSSNYPQYLINPDYSTPQQSQTSATVEDAPTKAPPEKPRAAPPPPTVDDFLEQNFIRFRCTCGKKIKVHAKYAGKTGKCQRCQKRIKVPHRT